MYLYKITFIISLTMSRNLWKTVFSEINITFLISSVKYYFYYVAHLFLNLFENFKTGVDYKRLDYQKRTNSLLIADRSNFLANETTQNYFLSFEEHVT